MHGHLIKGQKGVKIQVFLQLYNSFVFPYLIYCPEVWGTVSDIHIQPLIILLKKMYIPNKKLVFHRLGLQLYRYELDIIPITLRSLFTQKSYVHNYSTRNSNKLRPALPRHAYRDKYIYICTCVELYM